MALTRRRARSNGKCLRHDRGEDLKGIVLESLSAVSARANSTDKVPVNSRYKATRTTRKEGRPQEYEFRLRRSGRRDSQSTSWWASTAAARLRNVVKKETSKAESNFWATRNPLGTHENAPHGRPRLTPDKIGPTVGQSTGKITSPSTILQFWNLGGGIRNMWHKYYDNCHAVAYVVDRKRLKARRCLVGGRILKDGRQSRRRLTFHTGAEQSQASQGPTKRHQLAPYVVRCIRIHVHNYYCLDHWGFKKQDNHELTLDANACKHPGDHESGQDVLESLELCALCFVTDLCRSLRGKSSHPPFSFVLIKIKTIQTQRIELDVAEEPHVQYFPDARARSYRQMHLLYKSTWAPPNATLRKLNVGSGWIYPPFNEIVLPPFSHVRRSLVEILRNLRGEEIPFV
ncbi:hypothetical protein B0H16DRAFT_1456319 [Mycena metata]|uniref:Uncharacterized protein n=1 Tax=Mycena metata TaxID=1033252 RepID=A0AAD7JD81_9AGAR|nr:hypothetical protein B0H16DRAFT_1456319 [Mycena metata]